MPRMLEEIEASLERFRIHFDTLRAAERGRDARCPRRSRCSTPTRRTAPLWARTSAHGDDKDRVARPLERRRRRTSRSTPPTCAASTHAASTASSTSSAPITTATSPGCRRSPRCSATRASRSRCSSTSSSTSTRGGEATQDVEAPRRRRLPRRVRRRDRRRRRALVPRLARSRPDDRDRRRPRRREDARRTPSTTSSTRTRGSPGILAQRARAADARAAAPPSGRSRPRSATSSSGSLELPGRRRRGDGAARAARDPDVRDPRRRRLPPLLPPPQGARLRRGEPSGSRSARRRRPSSPVPRPARDRGARADVSAAGARTIALMRWNLGARRRSPRPGASSRCSPPPSTSGRRRSRSGGSRSPRPRSASSRSSTRRLDRLAPRGPPRRARRCSASCRRPLAALLRGGQARLGGARRADLLHGAAPHRRSAPPFLLGERTSGVVLGACVVGALGIVCDRARRGRRRLRCGRGGRWRGSARRVDVRRARDRSRSGCSARGDRAAHGRVLGLPRRRGRGRAGAAARRIASLPDDAGEWGAVLLLGDRLHRRSRRSSTRCSCATSRRRRPGCSPSSSRSPAVLLAWALLDEQPRRRDARRRRARAGCRGRGRRARARRRRGQRGGGRGRITVP